MIALIRTSRVPALFPLRLLGTVYVDLFRGIPLILLVYLFGFGIPALQLTGVPTDVVVLGGIALGLSYSGYVAEVYRAGIRSVHRSQRDAALAVGLTEGQAMRHVILPQAVRRVGPPLLNDFVALQKDVALISILGPQEAFRIAQIFQGQLFNSTPLIAAAILYLLITVPLARVVDRMGGPEGRLDERQAAGGRHGADPEVDPGPRGQGSHQGLRRARGPEGDRPRNPRAPGGGADRRLRLRQVDAAALHRPARGDRRRRRPARRRGDHRSRRRPDRRSAQARGRLPGLQPLPAPHRRWRT